MAKIVSYDHIWRGRVLKIMVGITVLVLLMAGGAGAIAPKAYGSGSENNGIYKDLNAGNEVKYVDFSPDITKLAPSPIYTDTVYSVSLSSDGTKIAASSGNDTSNSIKIFNVTVSASESVTDIIANDTWNYLKTFNENHLPLNWYIKDTNSSGKYFKPAEVGFHALSPILAYDMGLDCDGDGVFEPRDILLPEDDWDCSINRTSNTLNRLESLFTYQQSAHDIWKIGDNEAPPDYGSAAFDEFNQTKPFNPHYYIGAPISDFPKELNDDDLTQIFIHFNLTKEEADNEQLLFLDTLYATHDSIPYFNLRIKIGRTVDNLSNLGEYKFGSASNYPEYPEERYVAINEKYLEQGDNVLILENANPARSGYWIAWDSLRFGSLKKAYYQWYNTTGYVYSFQSAKLVPSIDNAWLVMSLIAIREYAMTNNEYALSNQINNILKGIDFTMWYNYADHKFFLGDIGNTNKGIMADFYSNENRIINFIARALGQINESEFKVSLKALNQTNGSYKNITVEKVNWGGVYFTYTSPALFIREKETSYVKTIENATIAQIEYARDMGYPCWGISDAISPINPDIFVGTGAPPAAGGYHDAGFLTPYAATLALVNKNPEILDKAIANINCLKNSSSLYDPQYGFKDSINATDNLTSTKFLTLDQEWILLSLANYRNNSIWKYFYMDKGVQSTHEEMYSASIWTVDDNVGADYTRIQDAIDHAGVGDTILVYSGTYYENVKVTKELTLIGISTEGVLPVIDAMENGSAIIITADGVKLEGFNLHNSSAWPNAGIKLISDANFIINNNVLSNKVGIGLESSNYNILSSNTVFSNNEYGIGMVSSSHNTLDKNKITNNHFGIFLNLDSINNSISKNNISNNSGGIRLEVSNSNKIWENNLNLNNGSAIFLWKSENSSVSSNIVSSNIVGIYLEYSHHNNLSNNDLSNNSLYPDNSYSNPSGIRLEFSSNNTIFENNVDSNNGIGISIWSSENNTLYDNNVTRNYDFGISLANSSVNKIYHNNLINNTIQASDDSNNYNLWDNDYPSGGNYWSDHICNESDGYGICKMAYTNIKGGLDAKDRYPFVKINGWIIPEVPAPTPTQPPSSSSGESSSGGGGGDSNESKINILLIEKHDEEINKDALTSFKFIDPKNPVMFVNITGNTSYGIITTSVEVLKNTSTLVKAKPDGLVYKNVNIWVGTTGYATPKNINESLIKFKVTNAWISDNGINSSNIKLLRWDGKNWITLQTLENKKDSKYYYFEGKTNEFSPFSITVIIPKTNEIVVEIKDSKPDAKETTVFTTQKRPTETPTITNETKTELPWLWIIFGGVLVIILYKFLRKFRSP